MADTVKRNKNGRNSEGKFVKGNKGGGRPAVAREFRERCREYMESDGWDNIIRMASDPKDRDKFRASELIAAYAYGKPKQGIELSDPNGDPLKIVLEGVLEKWAK